MLLLNQLPPFLTMFFRASFPMDCKLCANGLMKNKLPVDLLNAENSDDSKPPAIS